VASGFADREAAGRELALRLTHLREGAAAGKVVVLGLPRGGVPVAAQVAQALFAPLDVIVVRKLGLPWQPELAMGAIGEDGAMVLNEDIAGAVSQADLDRVVALERAELARRVALWRGGRERVPLQGRTVVIVDDGVATGATASAACAVARHAGAARVVVATPVAPPDVVKNLHAHADEVVAVLTPLAFRAVGQWYSDFTPTPDEAVTRLLSA
jgi:predicted phosphoribosyltransferase